MLKILSIMSVCISMLFSSTCSATDSYAVCINAKGQLGGLLHSFWSKVKTDPSWGDTSYQNYDPFCQITQFFPAFLCERAYINALKNALNDVGGLSQTIQVQGFYREPFIDYLKLQSPFLLALANAFVYEANVDQSQVIRPEVFPYYIRLRNNQFINNPQYQMGLANQLNTQITFNAPFKWSVCLYKKDSTGTLYLVAEIKLN